MRKIPSLFCREDAARGKQSLVVDRVTPGAEWALRRDEAWVATRKWDGTCVLVKDGKLYARFDAKAGKTPPPGAIPCQSLPDRETGHWPHWVLADRPEDRWIREAHTATAWALHEDGTYEAVGPAINSNNERLQGYRLVKHGESGWFESDFPSLSFDGLRAFLSERDIEGIVWHHADGRMCKLKRKDLGLPWPMHPARLYEAFGGRWSCERCGGVHDARHALCPLAALPVARDEHGRPKAGPAIRVDSTEIQ